jgi:hypothetical protein
MLSDAASGDLLTIMDVWEPERPSASKAAFVHGFACRYVRDSMNPRASPGGTPEAWDADLTATLVRESFEENQVRLGATAYLGYQEVHRPGRAPYAQVRMAGVIGEFAPRAPDPDGGAHLPAADDLAGGCSRRAGLGRAGGLAGAGRRAGGAGAVAAAS